MYSIQPGPHSVPAGCFLPAGDRTVTPTSTGGPSLWRTGPCPTLPASRGWAAVTPGGNGSGRWREGRGRADADAHIPERRQRLCRPASPPPPPRHRPQVFHRLHRGRAAGWRGYCGPTRQPVSGRRPHAGSQPALYGRHEKRLQFSLCRGVEGGAGDGLSEDRHLHSGHGERGQPAGRWLGMRWSGWR